ncbi:Rsph1 [Symbiodinium microadriaticum]|nr:Rsph1 [Symbiodinium microadriaticum]
MVFTDGSVYRGKFEKNRRHGHGHYRNQDGTPIYTGPWKNDEPGTGYADILYPSGHRYKGKVCDGCRDGKGSLWHQDSDGDSTFLYCGHWEDLYCRARDTAEDTLSYYDGEWEEDQPQGTGTFVDEHGQEFCDREFEQGDLVGSRLTGRSKRIFSVKTISSVSLSLSKQKPSSSKVLPGPKKEIPHAGTVCQNAGLLPEEEPAQTRVIDVGSGVSNARSRPAHCGPEDSVGLRWA